MLPSTPFLTPSQRTLYSIHERIEKPTPVPPELLGFVATVNALLSGWANTTTLTSENAQSAEHAEGFFKAQEAYNVVPPTGLAHIDAGTTPKKTLHAYASVESVLSGYNMAIIVQLHTTDHEDMAKNAAALQEGDERAHQRLDLGDRFMYIFFQRQKEWLLDLWKRPWQPLGTVLVDTNGVIKSI